MSTPSLNFNLNPTGSNSPLPGWNFPSFSPQGGVQPWSPGTPSSSSSGSAWSFPGAGGGAGSPWPSWGGGGTTKSGTLAEGYFAEPPLNPKFTGEFYNWLQGQLGKGATPYTGELNAPLDPTLQALQQFYLTGKGGPAGADALSKIAGSDYALTDFGAVSDAMQRSIAEGRANLKGQFAFGGNLAGTPFGTAAADYEAQSAKDLNSILAQMELQAAPTRVGAAQALLGGQEQLGQLLQGISQEDLMRLYQEFIRTQPEYSPLLNMEYGAATTFPPMYGGGVGMGAGGGLLSSLGSLPGILKGIGSLLPVGA